LLPPPVERHPKEELAYFWQYGVGSVMPPFGAAAMAELSQLKKQY
jgi:hypothetical protein